MGRSSGDKSARRVRSVKTKKENSAGRPYYGGQDLDYSEGGGFGRHRQTLNGESQEGSRNPSGTTVQPPSSPKPNSNG